jgi:hypothetical protein
VSFASDSVRNELKTIVDSKQLDFYDNFADFMEVVEGVFALNPHSVHSIKKHKLGIHGIALDNVNLIYTTSEDMKNVTIVKIELDMQNNCIDR